MPCPVWNFCVQILAQKELSVSRRAANRSQRKSMIVQVGKFPFNIIINTIFKM